MSMRMLTDEVRFDRSACLSIPRLLIAWCISTALVTMGILEGRSLSPAEGTGLNLSSQELILIALVFFVGFIAWLENEHHDVVGDMGDPSKLFQALRLGLNDSQAFWDKILFWSRAGSLAISLQFGTSITFLVAGMLFLSRLYSAKPPLGLPRSIRNGLQLKAHPILGGLAGGSGYALAFVAGMVHVCDTVLIIPTLWLAIKLYAYHGLTTIPDIERDRRSTIRFDKRN